MTKKRLPARTVEVCDRCGGESRCLGRCLICKCDFCLACRGVTAADRGIPLDVCLECVRRGDVLEVCDRHAAAIQAAADARDADLKKLKLRWRKKR